MATIIATGGAGFLGSHVVDLLRKHGHDVWVPRSASTNLTAMSDVTSMYKAVRPDIVIHMAAKCGGIGANQDQPGSFARKLPSRSFRKRPNIQRILPKPINRFDPWNFRGLYGFGLTIQ